MKSSYLYASTVCSGNLPELPRCAIFSGLTTGFWAKDAANDINNRNIACFSMISNLYCKDRNKVFRSTVTLCKRLIRQLSCYWRLWYQQQRTLVPHAISGGMLSIELSIKLMRYCAVAFLQGLQVPRRHLDISRARAHNGLLSRAICKVRRIMLENSSIMVSLINPENIALCLILQYASIV